MIHPLFLVPILGFGIAAGGAAKDAPHEGFDRVKFFRSPGVSIISGICLSVLYTATPTSFILLATAGMERIISECWKKIIHGRIPGKFNIKEQNKQWKKTRWKLLPIYALTIFTMLVILIHDAQTL